MTSAGPVRSPLEAVLVGRLLERPPTSARLPVGLLSRKEKAAELQRLQVRKAMDAAYEADLVLGLADDTPDTLDPPPGQPGARKGSWAADTELPGVSEFFAAELALVLKCGRGTASHLAHRAWTYRENLPATWAALATGALDEARAKVLVDVLAHATPATARAIESQLLPEATGLSTGRLRARALALLLEVDADAIDARRRSARRQADVRSYPSHLEGMSTLAADLPTPVSAECLDVVDQLAGMLKADGDPRPIGELRAAVLADLIRRPWDTSRPPVTAHLQVTAVLSSLAGQTAEPGEVNGSRSPPATSASCWPSSARSACRRPRTARSPSRSPTSTAGCWPPPPRRSWSDWLAGAAPPTADQDCDCPVLGRPAATQAYAPTAAQDAFLTTRDRTCRFPNCGQRVGWTDRDHVIPHACGGETDCANLCCLCRSHHRLKTLARGWRFVMDPDGTLHVTTPSGVTRTTRPPGMRTPAPEPEGSPPMSPAPDDESPPF